MNRTRPLERWHVLQINTVGVIMRKSVFDITKLQPLVELLASIMNVPAVLITGLSGDHIQVLFAA